MLLEYFRLKEISTHFTFKAMKELKMYIDGRFIENQSDKWIDGKHSASCVFLSKL